VTLVTPQLVAVTRQQAAAVMLLVQLRVQLQEAAAAAAAAAAEGCGQVCLTMLAALTALQLSTLSLLQQLVLVLHLRPMIALPMT
jgi:hypothetical protein